jgi:hypothetical protein
MIYPDLPIKALSIRQPWLSLILFDGKNIENRTRRNSHRGPVALHASLNIEKDVLADIVRGVHPVTGSAFKAQRPGCYEQVGGIVGVADIVDCVDRSGSDWFVGRYGFVLVNARPVPFIPVRGALGFFDWRKMLEKDRPKAIA